MFPSVLTELHPEDVKLFREISEGLEASQGVLEREDESITCHLLARAVAASWGGVVEDGNFLGSFSHSWIRTLHGNIIDVYPIAMLGGPLLVDGSFSTLSNVLYVALPEEEVAQDLVRLFHSVYFKREVSQLGQTLAVNWYKKYKMPAAT